MNPEDVGRILDEIGERIGPAGEYAWELTVRQVYIEGWAWLLAGIVVLAFAILLSGLLAYRFIGHRQWSDGATASVLMYGVIAWLVALPMVVVNLTVLLNPEYHAMTRLLGQLVPRQ